MKFKDYYKKVKFTYAEKLVQKFTRTHTEISGEIELELLDIIWKVEDYYNKKLNDKK